MKDWAAPRQGYLLVFAALINMIAVRALQTHLEGIGELSLRTADHGAADFKSAELGHLWTSGALVGDLPAYPDALSLSSAFSSSQAGRQNSLDDSGESNDLRPVLVIEKLEKKLGNGSYGNVYEAEVQGIGRVAAKFLDEEALKAEGNLEQSIADFHQEAKIHQELQHPSIVKCYGLAELAAEKAAEVGIGGGRGAATAMLMELMDPNKTLTKVLRPTKEPWQHRVQCALDIAQAVAFIHSRGVVVFDIKGDNVMVVDEGRCKLNDFGLALHLDFEETDYSGRGSVAYMAPEMLDKERSVDEKVDVFSFGILMWELMTGQEPHEELTYRQIKAGVLKGHLRPPYVRAPSESNWTTLMEECWRWAPSSRPSFSTIAGRLEQVLTL